jgi:hypothetical protein
MAGGRGHEVMGVGQAAGGAVIADEAVLAQHQTIARLADRQLGEGVGIQPVDELGGVGPLDIDLAERRHVTKPYMGASVEHFARHRRQPVVAFTREPA